MEEIDYSVRQRHRCQVFVLHTHALRPLVGFSGRFFVRDITRQRQEKSCALYFSGGGTILLGESC